MNIHHIPVLLHKIYNEIYRKSDTVIVDATLGEGGYSELFLERGVDRVIGFDRDKDIFEKATLRLERFGERFDGYNINFADASWVFDKYFGKINLALFDLGISQYHYKESGRGFSYVGDERLDMRLTLSSKLDAYQVVNDFPEEEIADILYNYGGERRSRQIAHAIIVRREERPIVTVGDLALLTRRFYPPRSHINPATRTFQALRIYVNDELGAIEKGLRSVVDAMAPGGKVVAISYHSLEDTIVKNTFKSYLTDKKNINKYREKQEHGGFSLFGKKPILPDREEIDHNPSARSAKMRILVKDDTK